MLSNRRAPARVAEKSQGLEVGGDHYGALLLVNGGRYVTVDVLFLRNRFWVRLFTNIGIVALFLIFYLVVVR